MSPDVPTLLTANYCNVDESSKQMIGSRHNCVSVEVGTFSASATRFPFTRFKTHCNSGVFIGNALYRNQSFFFSF